MSGPHRLLPVTVKLRKSTLCEPPCPGPSGAFFYPLLFLGFNSFCDGLNPSSRELNHSFRGLKPSFRGLNHSHRYLNLSLQGLNRFSPGTFPPASLRPAAAGLVGSGVPPAGAGSGLNPAATRRAQSRPADGPDGIVDAAVPVQIPDAQLVRPGHVHHALTIRTSIPYICTPSAWPNSSPFGGGSGLAAGRPSLEHYLGAYPKKPREKNGPHSLRLAYGAGLV